MALIILVVRLHLKGELEGIGENMCLDDRLWKKRRSIGWLWTKWNDAYEDDPISFKEASKS